MYYNFNIPVNKFFYSQFLLTGALSGSGIVNVSGMPDGLSFNPDNGFVAGAPSYIGAFNTTISYESGALDTVNINFNINPPQQNTNGYLYSLGPSLVNAKNLASLDFSNILVEQVVPGIYFNIAVVDQKVYVPPAIPVVTPTPSPSSVTLTECGGISFPYIFVLKNNSQSDCIDDFIITSTVTGNCSGFLDNTLHFGYTSGTPGSLSVNSVICSGYLVSGQLAYQPSGVYVPTGTGIYIPPTGNINYPSGACLYRFNNISAGGQFAISIPISGTNIVAWGDNSYGKVYSANNLSVNPCIIPVTLPTGYGCTTLMSAGGQFAMSLTTGGHILAWGDNSFQQTSTVNYFCPQFVAVNLPSGTGCASSISAGGQFAAAVMTGCKYIQWGTI